MGTEVIFFKRRNIFLSLMVQRRNSWPLVCAFGLQEAVLKKLQAGAALLWAEFFVCAAADDFQQQGDMAFKRVKALQTCEGHHYIYEWQAEIPRSQSQHPCSLMSGFIQNKAGLCEIQNWTENGFKSIVELLNWSSQRRAKSVIIYTTNICFCWCSFLPTQSE